MIPAPVARLFNRPVALLPAHVQTIEQLLQVNAASALFETSEYGQRKPYQVIGGVAEIVVDGLLLDGDDWCGWGVTSYSAIRQAFNAALADAVVQAIALTINSPGGVVNGCFDLADEIAAARDIKPVWAILNENAFSAAYAIASAASRIIIPRTGGAGSIGVVWMHTDVTAMLAQAGIKITTLQFGATKTDSYPTTTLTDAARVRMRPM